MGPRGKRVDATAPGGSASRVALCIGVSKYASSPLANPANDACDVAAALRDCGFVATLLLEPSLKQMLDALEAFAAAIKPGSTAVFFFAGALRTGTRQRGFGIAPGTAPAAAKARDMWRAA